MEGTEVRSNREQAAIDAMKASLDAFPARIKELKDAEACAGMVSDQILAAKRFLEMQADAAKDQELNQRLSELQKKASDLKLQAARIKVDLAGITESTPALRGSVIG